MLLTDKDCICGTISLIVVIRLVAKSDGEHLYTLYSLHCSDLRDIGCHVKVIDGCQQLDKETRYIRIYVCTYTYVCISAYSKYIHTVCT